MWMCHELALSQVCACVMSPFQMCAAGYMLWMIVHLAAMIMAHYVRSSRKDRKMLGSAETNEHRNVYD